MANKQIHAKLASVEDLARQYHELCELRAELERRSSRPKQSRPGRGGPAATDRPPGAEPKASDIRWVDTTDHLEKGGVLRSWRTMTGARCSFCSNNQVRRLIAGGSAFICDKVRAHGRRSHRCRKP
jgi:ClpX C4-type zinc finger